MKETGIAGRIERLADLPDPRVEGRTDHGLLDIVMLALCAVMSGAEGWDDIEDWGREREGAAALSAAAQWASGSRHDPAIAWVVFKINADRRIVLVMLVIVAGGIVLSWQTTTESSASSWIGPLTVAIAIAIAIAIACLCWAIDSNLTRKVSASNAFFIASIKGVIAGTVNTLIAMLLAATSPSTGTILATMAVGLIGYGISLILFELALRGLGTARTGTYFFLPLRLLARQWRWCCSANQLHGHSGWQRV